MSLAITHTLLASMSLTSLSMGALSRSISACLLELTHTYFLLIALP